MSATLADSLETHLKEMVEYTYKNKRIRGKDVLARYAKAYISHDSTQLLFS